MRSRGWKLIPFAPGPVLSRSASTSSCFSVALSLLDSLKGGAESVAGHSHSTWSNLSPVWCITAFNNCVGPVVGHSFCVVLSSSVRGLMFVKQTVSQLQMPLVNVATLFVTIIGPLSLGRWFSLPRCSVMEFS